MPFTKQDRLWILWKKECASSTGARTTRVNGHEIWCKDYPETCHSRFWCTRCGWEQNVSERELYNESVDWELPKKCGIDA